MIDEKGIKPVETYDSKEKVDTEKELRAVKKSLEIIHLVMLGVILVLFGIVVSLLCTFVSWLHDDYKYKDDMYKDYKNEVRLLNEKVDRIQNNRIQKNN